MSGQSPSVVTHSDALPIVESASAGDGLRRVHLFGLDFIDAPTVDAVAEVLIGTPRRPVSDDPAPLLVTPNVDQMVKIDQGFDEVAAGLVARARYVLPDGQPIVWASRLLGHRLAARLPGSSFIAALWPRLVASGTPVFVVAASDEVATRITDEHPAATVRVAPILRPDQPETIAAFADTCLAAIDIERVEFVFVGLGFPSRERLTADLLERWPASAPAPVFCAIGASFEMRYGFQRRAPQWVQRVGLEWLFRFLQEPRRLFRRYFVDDVAFVPLVWREWRRRRSR